MLLKRNNAERRKETCFPTANVAVNVLFVCSENMNSDYCLMFHSIGLQCCPNGVQRTRGSGLHNLVLVKTGPAPRPDVVNSYLISSPESGVSDIAKIAQTVVLTLLSSKCCEYNVPNSLILFFD